MSSIGVVIVVVLAIFAASLLGAWLRGGSPNADTKDLREELQRLVTAQAQAFSAQFGQVTQVVSQELSEVRRQLDQGVATTGRMTTDAQKEMTDQLRSSTDVLKRLNDNLGKMQESGQEMTQAAQKMQTVLGGPKSRGVLGEEQLDSLLADVLPRASYETDHRFSNGSTVAAALRAGGKWIAIAADFPIDAYRKLAEKGDSARPDFAQAVRSHADEIAAKFIRPEDATMDLALMYVPSEGAFYDLLVTADEKGHLDDYCRQKRVLPVSPNTLHAYLCAVLVAMKGAESEQKSIEMLARLHEVKRVFEQFAEAHTNLGRMLQRMRLDYEQSGRALEQTREAFALATRDVPEQKAAGEITVHAEEIPQLAVATTNNGA
jgi:DNA recombination protein RmuC